MNQEKVKESGVPRQKEIFREFAEARGFEPLARRKADAGFQDRCIQPDSATPPEFFELTLIVIFSQSVSWYSKKNDLVIIHTSVV